MKYHSPISASRQAEGDSGLDVGCVRVNINNTDWLLRVSHMETLVRAAEDQVASDLSAWTELLLRLNQQNIICQDNMFDWCQQEWGTDGGASEIVPARRKNIDVASVHQALRE